MQRRRTADTLRLYPAAALPLRRCSCGTGRHPRPGGGRATASSLTFNTYIAHYLSTKYECREAQADGEYAEALARCGAAAAALDSIRGLAVADQLAAAIDELTADTVTQLASALQAVCTDFHGNQFLRVIRVDLSPHLLYENWLQLASILHVVCTTWRNIQLRATF